MDFAPTTDGAAETEADFRRLRVPARAGLTALVRAWRDAKTAKRCEGYRRLLQGTLAIEELFKALKTGCAFEERQLESLPALLNALAVFVPIAVELLALRTAARTDPDRPASEPLRPTQILVLELHKTTQLPMNATARAAFLAIARLGGHIPNNGEPGWIVLGRGYQKLLELEEGARLVLAGPSSASAKT